MSQENAVYHNPEIGVIGPNKDRKKVAEIRAKIEAANEAEKHPTKTIKDVFYSKSDDRLFWVAGYTWDDNTSNVFEKIKHLQEHSKTFADWAGCKQNNVNTIYVDRSRRYKNMRVFFIDKPKVIPADAFAIRNEPNWGMFQFLQD